MEFAITKSDKECLTNPLPNLSYTSMSQMKDLETYRDMFIIHTVFVVCHLLSVICCLSSVVCHLLSVVCRLSSVVNRRYPSQKFYALRVTNITTIQVTTPNYIPLDAATPLLPLPHNPYTTPYLTTVHHTPSHTGSRTPGQLPSLGQLPACTPHSLPEKEFRCGPSTIFSNLTSMKYPSRKKL
jgi:hypothetical protein